MDKRLNELMEDLDKVLGLIKKVEESSIEDVEDVKKEIELTRKELKGKYGKKKYPLNQLIESVVLFIGGDVFQPIKPYTIINL